MIRESVIRDAVDITVDMTGERVRRIVWRLHANTALFFTDHYVTRVGLTARLCAEAEAACAATARAGGVPAPEVIASGYLPDGSGYLLCRAIAGWPPRRAAALSAAGGLLARLHQLDRSAFPVDQHSRRRRRERFAIAGAAAGSLLDAERLRWAAGPLAAARRDWDSNRSCPAHGDFGARNLLAWGDEIRGVVDWTDARQASPESDLGQVDIEDLPAVWAGYQAAAASSVDIGLAAGHSIARYLALEHVGVMAAGASRRAADWWRHYLAAAA